MIESHKEHEEKLETVGELMIRPDLNKTELAQLETLINEIVAYEAIHWPTP